MMTPCGYCGAETQLFANGQPICLDCADDHCRGRKPSVNEVKFNDRAVPNQDQLVAARLVLIAAQNGGTVSQAHALIVRLWAGPAKGVLPLDEIAREMLSVDGGSPDRPTQI